MTDLRIINWNTGILGSSLKSSSKVEYLETLRSTRPYVMVLQEVLQTGRDALIKRFTDDDIVFSLDLRPPGEFDTGARKKGVALVAGNGAEIVNYGILDRSVFPDRTIWADIEVDGIIRRVFGLHSLTGCSYNMTKSVQYDTFTEYMASMKPDVVCIDANEPDKDGLGAKQMKFYVQGKNGKGAERFFREMERTGLTDSWVGRKKCFPSDATSDMGESESLPVSHVMKNGKKKRYDFVFIDESRFPEHTCRYDLKGSIATRSDHAAVIVDSVLNSI